MINKQFLYRFWLCLISTALMAVAWFQFQTFLFPRLSLSFTLLFSIGFGTLFWITTQPSFFRKYVGESTPETLGAIRIITCSVALIMVLVVDLEL
ncbi:MAG TPA: hypothetical protein DCF68_01525 [Cyanothece sp. UBA12306]|nr:hypothetical protein [Cyanothece sp. UBA12306]